MDSLIGIMIPAAETAGFLLPGKQNIWYFKYTAFQASLIRAGLCALQPYPGIKEAFSMMYLILTAVLLTAILRLKADAVKPAERAVILLLLVFCAAAVPAGGPVLAEQAGP